MEIPSDKKSNVASNNNKLDDYIKNCSRAVKNNTHNCYRLRCLRWQTTARALLSCATLHSPTHPVPQICTSPASVCASSQSTPRCRKTRPKWAVITLKLNFFLFIQHCRARGVFFILLNKKVARLFPCFAWLYRLLTWAEK